MKKLILAVAVLAVSFSAQAQLTFGVKAGANLSSISDLGGSVTIASVQLADMNTSFKFGFNAGAFAEYRLNDMFGVQGELLFSMQGTNYDGTLPILGEYTGNYASSYINVPVLAKLHFRNIAVYAGPQFGYMIGFNQTSEGKDSTTTTKLEDYNAFDLSVAVGASYMITRNIGVDARYNLGMTNVFAEKTDSDGKVTAEAYGKNGSIQVGVFYAF